MSAPKPAANRPAPGGPKPRAAGQPNNTAAPASDSGGRMAYWLPIFGGLTLIAGIAALLLKLFFGNKNCPRIKPKLRRWPETKKSWFK